MTRGGIEAFCLQKNKMNSKMDIIEEEIREVAEKIKQLERVAEKGRDMWSEEEVFKYRNTKELWKEKARLAKEKESLRKEKECLRKEEESLRKEEEQLREIAVEKERQKTIAMKNVSASTGANSK